MHGNDENDGLESSKAALIEAATPYFPEPGRKWFDEALQVLAASNQPGEDLALCSAMARRKLGEELLREAPPIASTLTELDLRRWNCAEAARMAMLITAVGADPASAQGAIDGYYRTGDESERIALVRGLVLFAPADFLTAIALDAGRTNNLEVLAALALDNPFPAVFYNDDQFNQMVLKALFLGLAIERVQGLQQRANPELARMGENYVVEREQAGRDVPVDVWLAIAPCASDTGRRQLVDYLAHEDVGHRYYCSLGLSRRSRQDPSLLPILRRQLDREQDPLVIELLQDALQP